MKTDSMRKDLDFLLEALRAERTILEGEKDDLAEQGRTLNTSRNTAARRCLRDLLPSLDDETIDGLRSQAPGFEIPMTKGFMGLGKKLDPSVSLDALRIQLGAYLDNTEDEVPEAWREEVRSLDEAIRNLQDNLVLANEERLSEIDSRIKAIEKLLRVDVAKMKPEVRTKLTQAIASQAKAARQSPRPFRSVRSTGSSGPVHFPTQHIYLDSGMSPLEMWFWYELLTPDSECRCEVDRVDDQVGGFGNEDDVTPGDPENNSDVPIGDEPATVSSDSSMADHEALGSQAYS